MAKELNELSWIEDFLPSTYIRKHMFGGFAYYVNSKLVLLAFENTGDRKYKNKVYDYEIWNGCMFPAEKEHHEKLKNKFPFFINHPVLPKWLYLPLDTENFEENIRNALKDLKKNSSLLGTIPKSKQKKLKFLKNEKIDLKKPKMFGDDYREDKISTAKTLADLKNFGPATEKTLHKAGIKTVAQFVKLGWKKSLIKLVKLNPKNRHSIFTYVLIGALQNKEWHKLSAEEKLEARQFTASLKKN